MAKQLSVLEQIRQQNQQAATKTNVATPTINKNSTSVLSQIKLQNQKNNTTITIEEPVAEPIRKPIPTNNIENIQKEYRNISNKIANYGSASKDNYAEKIFKSITGSYGKEQKSKEYQKLIKKQQELRKQIEENSLKQKQTGSEKYLNTVSGGLQTGLKGIESTINKVNPLSGFKTSNDSTALTYEQKKAQAAMEQTKNPITKAGLGIVSSVSQRIPQMAVGNPVGALAIGFANYGGGAYNQAKQEGKTEAQATKYGIAIGALEMGLQKALGGLTSIYGKSELGKIIDNVLKKIISNKMIRDVIANTGGEFTEEYSQDILNPIVRNLTMGENNKFKLYTPQALESGILGALTAGIIETPKSLAKASQQTNVQPSTITPTTPQTTQGVAQIQPQEQVNTTINEIKENIPLETQITPQKETKTQKKINYPTKVIQSSLNADEKFVLNDEKKIRGSKIVNSYNFKDFYRNMRNLFDKGTANKITGEFDKAKLNNVNLNNELATDLKKNIVDKYNIQKGSKDSALIQKYGEKLISEEELKKQSPKNWENIKEADKYFRKQYDVLIDKINAVRKTIYPNVEKTIQEYENKIQNITNQIITKQSELKTTSKNTKKYDNLRNQINNLNLRKQSYISTIESDEILRNKRVEKRQDYYRHFQELAEGFKALENILTTSSDISPKMVGISDFTKPNTKFSSITQQRKGNSTKYDAVGGFLNYIPTASFMINIDPQIYKLRKMTSDIRSQMGEDTSANNAIEYLTEFTNILAGKQTHIDRTAQKIFSRKAMKGLNWTNSRIKSNLILGNVNSAISQVLNLPQVVGKVKNPVLLGKGFIATLNPKTDYSKSQFITERYKSDILSQFDNKLIDQPKKFAKWMLEALDEKVTKTGWNALYQEALNKNIENPIQYADNNIRDLVAGRGIGEKTIYQESKVVQAFLPFTVEVGNLMRVYGDLGKNKDIIGLIILLITSNLLNKGVKKIGASGKTADYLEAVKDALTEEDLTIFERLGRVGGEVLSNVPLGQQIAALYPEYGSDKLPTRKQLFGDNDPTRFGTGSMYSKIITKPLTTLGTPYGGSQLEKIKKGYEIIKNGGEYKNGKMKYPVSKDFLNSARALTFGSTKETQEFYDKNRKILSENQTKQVENSSNIKSSYETIMKFREYNSLMRKYEEKINKATGTEKAKLYKELQEKIKELYNK